MLGLLTTGWLDAGSPRGAQAQLALGWGWQLSAGRNMPGLLGTVPGGPGAAWGPSSHHVTQRGTSGFPRLVGEREVGTWGQMCWAGVACGRQKPCTQRPSLKCGSPRAYLEVHQLELEKLSTQIRESKRNSRLVSVVWEEPYGERCGLPGLWAHLGQTVVRPCPRAEPASVGTSGASLGSGVGLHRAPVLLPCTLQPRLGAAWPH